MYGILTVIIRLGSKDYYLTTYVQFDTCITSHISVSHMQSIVVDIFLRDFFLYFFGVIPGDDNTIGIILISSRFHDLLISYAK